MVRYFLLFLRPQDTTGYSIGDQCTVIKVNLINFDSFYLLSQGVSVIDVSSQVVDVHPDLRCRDLSCLCLVKMVTFLKATCHNEIYLLDFYSISSRGCASSTFRPI